MSTPQDTEFYRRREHQERVQAERAACRDSRRIHHELANQYARLLGYADRPRSWLSMPH